MLTIGLAYETKSVFQDFEFDNPGAHRHDPGRPVPRSPAATDKLAFDQPGVVPVGVAWRALPAAAPRRRRGVDQLVRGDGEEQAGYTNDTSATGAMPLNMNWDDQVVFKIGAEVTVAEGSPLRAGFNYGKNPLDPARAFENIAFPAVAESHLTLGAGLGRHRDAGHQRGRHVLAQGHRQRRQPGRAGAGLLPDLHVAVLGGPRPGVEVLVPWLLREPILSLRQAASSVRCSA